MLRFKQSRGPVLSSHSPPPLPSLDNDLFRRAFTANKAEAKACKFEYPIDFVDNDRLEYLGDAMLYAIVANYLYKKYPRLKVHFLSMIRQKLVMNTTLAMWTRLYHLDSALQLNPSEEHLRTDVKVQADAFEAYVGALTNSLGPDVVTKWIILLVEPYVEELYDYYRSETLTEEDRDDDDRLSLFSTTEDATHKRIVLCGVTLIKWRVRSEANAATHKALETTPLLQPHHLSVQPSTASSTQQTLQGSSARKVDKMTNDTSTQKTHNKLPKHSNIPEDEFKYSDVSKLQCLLCSRQLKDLDTLRKHNIGSQLHANNLTQPAVVQAAVARKTALQHTVTSAKKAKNDHNALAPASSSPRPGSDMTPTKHSSTTSQPNQNVKRPQQTPAKAIDSPMLTQYGVTFPAQVFSSMPNEPEDENARYFLLSCAGSDCQDWYSAVFDRNKTLIGHARGASKQIVVEAAIANAKSDQVPVLQYKFSLQKSAIPLHSGDLKAAPGAHTRLLHLFKGSTVARVLWLSWFSASSDIWKDVCMIDGEFRASGKHASAKEARKISSEKTVDSLAKAA